MQARFSLVLLVAILFLQNLCFLGAGSSASASALGKSSNSATSRTSATENADSGERGGKIDMNTISKSRDAVPIAEPFLLRGALAEGEKHLNAHLKQETGDDQARFGLGMLQFLRALERVVQELHRFGLGDRARLGVFRVPVPGNPDPERISYAACRQIAMNLISDLSKAEKNLSEVKDPELKLPLHFGLIKLDLNGDGKLEEEESLWRIFAASSRSGHIDRQTAEAFIICFDRGDVHWLRGYCNLIMAFCQIYLAYDSKELFDCTAHLLFPRVESPYPFLSKGRHVRQFGGSDVDIVDLIALIHLLRFELVEPERMPAALKHFKIMVAESKLMWQSIMAETDDDREWIPNPRQTGVIPDVKVTDEMVSSWNSLMEKSGAVLEGKLLIAFWRGDDPGRGVNLSKVFLQPGKLDLVLWIQGAAAAPYLEEGETTKIETWRSLQAAFGRQFPGFAIWFN